jgi:hypothetical protein
MDKKIKLNLEDLQLDSFEVMFTASEAGTVLAAADADQSGPGVTYTCPDTCTSPCLCHE